MPARVCAAADLRYASRLGASRALSSDQWRALVADFAMQHARRFSGALRANLSTLVGRPPQHSGEQRRPAPESGRVRLGPDAAAVDSCASAELRTAAPAGVRLGRWSRWSSTLLPMHAVYAPWNGHMAGCVAVLESSTLADHTLIWRIRDSGRCRDVSEVSDVCASSLVRRYAIDHRCARSMSCAMLVVQCTR